MPPDTKPDDSTPKSRSSVSKERCLPITHNSYEYIYAYTLKDGKLLYKCAMRSCLARIKVDKVDSSVTELSQHSAHRSPSTNIDKANGNYSSLNSAATLITSGSGRKQISKSVDQTKHQALRKSVSLSDSDQNNGDDQSKSIVSLSSNSTPNIPNVLQHLTHHSRDASQSSFSESSTNVHINASEVPADSNEILGPCHEPSTPIPLQSSEYYKIKYDELHQINSSLIDKIVEKERLIWEHEKCIADLRSRLQELEIPPSSNELPNPPLQNDNRIQTDLEDYKKLVEDLLTTVRTLEAALRANEKENEKGSSPTPKACSSKAITSVRTNTNKQMSNPSKQQKSSQKNTNKKPNKLVLVGDSHVRQLDNILGSNRTTAWDIHCAYQGGSKLCRVTDLIEERGISLLPGDTLVVFSGTNDVSHTSWNGLKTSYEEIIAKYHQCKIGIMLIPARKGDHHLNPHITLMNQKIVKFLATKTVSTLDPHSVLGNADYSPDGLHMNSHGKKKICELIRSNLMEHMEHSAESVIQRSQVSHDGRGRQSDGGRGRQSDGGRGRVPWGRHGRVWYNSNHRYGPDPEYVVDPMYHWTGDYAGYDYDINNMFNYDNYNNYYHYDPYYVDSYGLDVSRDRHHFFE
uniref:SGNH hydrolase-type esterase domain-containing protein n=1 Tax=Cacopsylla melanoneura TaxID=428564 RepID=A0A8D8YU53_9HEMI